MKKKAFVTHQEVLKRYFKKDGQLKKKIEKGVDRLKVIVQIIERRKQMGLTQSQLAKRMGVSEPFIAKIENDEAVNLSLETLVKIADALDSEVEINFHSAKKAA